MATNKATDGKLKIGNGAFTIVAVKAATYNPGNLADGAGETSADIAVAGAKLGDAVLVAAPYDLQGLTVTAYVKSAGVVSIRVQNESGGAVDLASGTWKILVLRW